ncbi:Metallo-dependent phosphatase-like protein [Pavlovales sp. CCMP2436]|nr:Metallo-dependent phosphatase-like protein [Pavlovales sp. CCMP2436]
MLSCLGHLALLLVGAAASEAERWSSVWAIGDLHGDAACTRYWVARSGLVEGLDGPPGGWRWADESSALVFMGDYVDKGPEARDVLLFVKALTTLFPGRVHALLGNHELNLLNDRSRVSGLAKGAEGYRYLELAWGAAHPAQYLRWLPAAERESPDAKTLC